jgi:transposase
MLKLTDNDVAATRFLELWTMTPSPAEARHLRKSTVDRLLARYRIRRVDGETVAHILRQPAIKVADGVAEAAGVHIRSLVTRLHVVTRELQDVEHRLDELCAAIGETMSATAGSAEPRDVAILRSLPGIGRINLATLLAEASGPLSRRDYQGLRTLSGVASVTKRSSKSHIVVMRGVADRLLALACIRLQRQTPFDPHFGQPAAS